MRHAVHTRATAESASDEARWQAVLCRNRAFDGAFVYGVVSTGIFCRPSCPARRPSRARVVFFSSPQEAIEAGYRPCLRCTPHERSPQVATIVKACRYLKLTAMHGFSLASMAHKLGLSRSYMSRLFKQVTGLSARQYQLGVRAAELRRLLRTDARVVDALSYAGLTPCGLTYRAIVAWLGMTPRCYQRGGQGCRIFYSKVKSPWGYVLAAVTSRGVCYVSVDGSPFSGERKLRQEFPRAEIVVDNAQLRTLLVSIVPKLLDPHGELPDELRAYSVQLQVWFRLQRGLSRAVGIKANTF